MLNAKVHVDNPCIFLPLATPGLLAGHLNAGRRLGPGRIVQEEDERTEEGRMAKPDK